mgnify:FL=1
MKKFSYFAVILSLIFLLSSCANKKDVNVNPSDITSDIINTFSEDISMSELNSDRITKYYDIDMEKIESFSSYIEGSGGFADEVSVFKMKSEDDISAAKEAVESRIAQRKKDFDGYNSWELDKIEENCISVQGKYILFVISDNSQEAEKIFKDYLK